MVRYAMLASPRVILADLENPEHARAVRDLVNAYAGDAMGGGEPLPDEVLAGMVPGLRRHPTARVLLAYLDGVAVGVAVCMLGFSTFAARPLLNLHDLAVSEPHRGQGVGRALLAAVENHAQELGCCKVTLEVRADNQRAMHIYRQCGYGSHDPDTEYHFWHKPLKVEG